MYIEEPKGALRSQSNILHGTFNNIFREYNKICSHVYQTIKNTIAGQYNSLYITQINLHITLNLRLASRETTKIWI